MSSFLDFYVVGLIIIRNFATDMESSKVVHLRLNEPFEGQTDFYFGSIKAIYDSIPKERIGIGYKSLTNHGIKGNLYKNSLCTIDIGVIRRKPIRNKKQ